ncbi:MAG: endopeptidase La, partial [Anaerolineae bacterium]|nr:endopeptidase La [Anaerolineae bacterium]
ADQNGIHEFHAIHNAPPDQHGLIELPLIPAQMVIYPQIVSPVPLLSSRAVAAAEAALRVSGTALLVMVQPGVDPAATTALTLDQLMPTGGEIAIGRIIKLPDEQQSAIAQGRHRIELTALRLQGGMYVGTAQLLQESGQKSRRNKATMQAVMDLFKRAIELNETIPDEVLVYAMNADSPGWLADLVASTLTLSSEERQTVLETLNVADRLELVGRYLGEELNILELRDEITGQLQQEMDRSQRDLYLREQVRILQGELGEDDPFQAEINEVRAQIEKAGLPEEVQAKALKELSRLQLMPPMAPEVGIVRTYIDWLTEIPWSKATEDKLDIKEAQKILDRDHYGLPKVKDRILEYIAVRTLAAAMPSPILCFVGPPGVGKTSLGRSIASTMGREFVRVSLGGVRDEAEIRGHRRTYIGALPGRIVQTMRRAGTINPVFMLDEIDKLGADFRGDPSAALLEVLDPEQNHAFSDHYLEVPYDLSKALFICTANDLDPLPPALLDRLEVIEFGSYTEEEKVAISRQFLIPKQIAAHGLQDERIEFETPALRTLIHEYTYEAGVRNVDREIANVLRKIARLKAEKKRYPRRVTARQIGRFLGPAPFDEMRANETDEVGVATGLAWTPFGGDVLTIEVAVVPGKGNLTLTGSLGEVMQESAQTALSYLRGHADDFGVPNDDFETFDIHVHLPEGAVPKDGPSAGVTLATAMISAFTERTVNHDYAMTGEVTLRGKILPVGGVKEKVLAARRARLKTVLLPRQNERDLVDVPAEVRESLEIVLIDTMQDVLSRVLSTTSGDENSRLSRLRRERDKAEEEAD